MGKKARERRKQEKRQIAKVYVLQQFVETEFGELKRKVTKAEVRRRALAQYRRYLKREAILLGRMAKAAHDEIVRIEDGRFFAALEAAIDSLPASV